MSKTPLQRLNDLSATLAVAYSNFVRPLYCLVDDHRKEDGTKIEHLASCLLLDIAERHFIVTAMHAIAAANRDNIFIGAKDGVVSIEGPAFEAPDYDITCIPINTTIRERIKDTPFYSANQIYNNGRAPFHYFAYGYPNSRNRNVREGEIIPRSFGYMNRPADDTLFQKLRLDRKTHIILPYNKMMFDELGNKSSPVKLQGCSGGALVAIPSLHFDKGHAALTSQLAGMMIEYRDHHKVIVGVKLSFIVAMIKRYMDGDRGNY